MWAEKTHITCRIGPTIGNLDGCLIDTLRGKYHTSPKTMMRLRRGHTVNNYRGGVTELRAAHDTINWVVAREASFERYQGGVAEAHIKSVVAGGLVSVR